VIPQDGAEIKNQEEERKKCHNMRLETRATMKREYGVRIYGGSHERKNYTSHGHADSF